MDAHRLSVRSGYGNSRHVTEAQWLKEAEVARMKQDRACLEEGKPFLTSRRADLFLPLHSHELDTDKIAWNDVKNHGAPYDRQWSL